MLTTTILTHWGQSKLPSILRVESDPPIDRLNDDNDARLISQAMKRNTNLEVICLDLNNFTSNLCF